MIKTGVIFIYNKQKKDANSRYYRQTQVYGRRNWTSYEIDLIMDHNLTDRELSAKLHRSMKAIQTKRYKLRRELLSTK